MNLARGDVISSFLRKALLSMLPSNIFKKSKIAHSVISCDKVYSLIQYNS